MRISLEQALQIIDTHVQQMPSVSLPCSAALHRILQESIFAEMTQPPFPRSPLDGYALKATDTTGASPETPKAFQVIDKSFAGFPAKQTLSSGQAIRIMTGAPIPEGADCVIRQEDTDYGESTVQIFSALKPYQNYCFAGEDYEQGQLLVSAPHRITAGTCAVLSSAGICQVRTNALPRVAVLSTGSELQPAGTVLRPGKIYDANAAYLKARLSELQIPQVTANQIPDDPAALEKAFRLALEEHDFVISSGGVSVGQADLVPQILEALGGIQHFHGVEIKPGMPAAFYTVQGKPVLALSGNPFACVVTFELLGRQILAAMSGDEAMRPVCQQVALQDTHDKARPIRRFFSGTASNGTVWMAEAQQNGKTHMLVNSNCIVELPAGNEPLAAGTMVSTYFL